MYFFLRKLVYVLYQSWNFHWITIKQTTGKYVKKYYFEWKNYNGSRKSATVIFTFFDDVIKKLLMLAVEGLCSFESSLTYLLNPVLHLK